MTQNAAIKLGLEALRDSIDEDLNRDAVEIAVLTGSGYTKMSRDDTLKQIDRLS